jgi:hypothetical protein
MEESDALQKMEEDKDDSAATTLIDEMVKEI